MTAAINSMSDFDIDPVEELFAAQTPAYFVNTAAEANVEFYFVEPTITSSPFYKAKSPAALTLAGPLDIRSYLIELSRGFERSPIKYAQHLALEFVEGNSNAWDCFTGLPVTAESLTNTWKALALMAHKDWDFLNPDNNLPRFRLASFVQTYILDARNEESPLSPNFYYTCEQMAEGDVGLSRAEFASKYINDARAMKMRRAALDAGYPEFFPKVKANDIYTSILRAPWA